MAGTEIKDFRDRPALENYVESTYGGLIDAHFSGLYVYCLQTGSFVYGGGTPGKSDIDITVVFKDDIYHFPKEKLLERIKGFIDGYLRLHREVGFSPDLVFPGEFVTISMIKDAIEGRGYHVDADGKLSLPKASTGYYLEDPERWFRAWCSQSAFNRFMGGDRALFESNKVGAWTSILKFIFSNQGFQPITLNGLFGFLRPFGVHHDYWNFRTLEEDWIVRALQEMGKQGFIDEISSGTYVPVQSSLRKWNVQLATRLGTEGIKSAQFLLNMEETLALAQYASYRWESMHND